MSSQFIMYSITRATLKLDAAYSRQLTNAGEWENLRYQILRGKLDFTSDSKLASNVCLDLRSTSIY